MIRFTVLLYVGLFIIQLGFYLLSPSFYVSAPEQLHLPGFVLWSFAKYFSWIFLMYLGWGLLLGLWNRILLPLNQPRGNHVRAHRPLLALGIAQGLGSFLYLAYLFPALLNEYPLLRRLPLGGSYALLALAVLSLGCYFLRFRSQPLWRGIFQIVLSLLLPVLMISFTVQKATLDLPPAAPTAKEDLPDILLLGIDALDGDSGNGLLIKRLRGHRGVIFTNAYTPLPLTHPAWNSILSGVYPENHGVRYFFDSPLKSKNPDLFLPKILQKEKGYRSLFASDQTETSYFTRQDGFSEVAHDRIGWEAHMVSALWNHFVLPALFLNNGWVERWTHVSFNYANLFNFDLRRFINHAFNKFDHLGPSPKLLAFHTCSLHTPIHLTREELESRPHYWALAPADFSFARWPQPGQPQRDTPPQWINPYTIRQKTVLGLVNELLTRLEQAGYLKNDLVVLLSDHGERFLEDREIYGGVHGVDIKTRRQNNVVLAFLDPKAPNMAVRPNPVGLVDLTPTLLARLGMETEGRGFDGLALLNSQGRARPLPERSLWVESMGFIDDSAEKKKFPTLDRKSLEESLAFGRNGSITIGKDYYARILEKKETADLNQNPDL